MSVLSCQTLIYTRFVIGICIADILLSVRTISLLLSASQSIQVIALGNGMGSRQAGEWLSDLISRGHFLPLHVRYAVVSECGASVYSASSLAVTELPELDVSLRGAVSIARRLQDPLAELVKVEPKHLGVGMYQHDVPERRLVQAVQAVMEECISFVGVDINAAPLHLLARVAGLSEKKAQSIIAHRSAVGAFRSRGELRKVCVCVCFCSSDLTGTYCTHGTVSIQGEGEGRISNKL